MKAPWKLQTARMRCPHCRQTVWMVFKGRWSIHRMKGEGAIDGPTPQSPSLYSPESEPPLTGSDRHLLGLTDDDIHPPRAEDDSDG